METKFRLFVVALALGLLGLSLGHLPAVQAAPLAQLTSFPTPTPGADGRILYQVQEGDTLWRISAITGATLDDLRTFNRLGPDDPIRPGDLLIIGLAAAATATPAADDPSFTPAPVLPTATPPTGSGTLCVILYDDRNGDSLRQDEEPAIVGGKISLTNRTGTTSLASDTAVALDKQCYDEFDEPTGYVLFEEVLEDDYSVTAAAPEGYNATTALSRSFKLTGGSEVFLSFGAQANTERQAETAIIPDAPTRSPLLAIIGGALLLFGIGLSIYAGLTWRGRGG